MLKKLIKLANDLDQKGYANEADVIDHVIYKLAQIQATHLLVVSAMEMFGQARWDARLTAVETGLVEDTFSSSTEEDLKNQVTSGVAGRSVKIASSTKNSKPIILEWDIPYQEQANKADDYWNDPMREIKNYLLRDLSRKFEVLSMDREPADLAQYLAQNPILVEYKPPTEVDED